VGNERQGRSGMAVEQHNQRWMTALEGFFVLIALVAGYWVAGTGMEGAIPLVLGMAAFFGVRLLMRRPFHEALAGFVAISAFNYYYFYCARLTGRNPTDLGTWGVPATSMEKLLKDLVFFGLLGLATFQLLHKHLENRPLWSRRMTHPLMLLISLFAVYSVLRGITWIFQGESLYDLLYYVRGNVEYAVLPLILATVLIKKEQQLAWICKGIVYTLPIVSALGIAEFFLHGSPFVRSFGGGHIFYRATSTLQNPNNLGGYLATALGVGIIYFLAKQFNRWERWIFIATLPLGLACLFMTLSRSSILFMVATTGICLALRWIAHRRSLPPGHSTLNPKWIMWGSLALIGGSYVLLTFFDFKHAILDAASQYLDPTSSTAGYRIFAPLFTLHNLLEHPFRVLFGSTWTQVNFGPDNAFAYVLLRNGLVGFVLYASIWGIALWTCLRRVLWRYCHFLYWICAYVLFFQFLYAFSAPIHENFPHNMYFWLVIGVLAWLESEPTQHATESHSLESIIKQMLAIEHPSL
jgi:hypothetical protein